MFSWRWPKSAFIAGEPTLDFLNTVDFRGRTRDANRLTSYAALVAWSLAAEFITEHEARAISSIAASTPSQADQTLTELLQWRETVHKAFSAMLQREQASVEDWRAIELSIQKAITSASLKYNQFGIIHWQIASIDITTISKRLALHLSKMLCSEIVVQIKKCEGCTWFFIDTSKNHRRRWCAMATCGSRAKALRLKQKLPS